MKSVMKFYLAIFFRRIHYFLVIFGVIAFASVTLSRLLPPLYVSQARLLVEAAQIPGNLAASTVQTSAGEQLQIIQQRLMTRANLLEIARQYSVFQNMGEMTADEIVSQMRSKSNIWRRGGGGQAIIMNVGFQSENASIAANVANHYVTYILNDNIEIRRGRAGETLEFFEQEVERLNGELGRQSNLIVQFKNANSDALPSTLGYRLNQQTRLQDRISNNEREISTLSEQKLRLVQIFKDTGRVTPIEAAKLTPEEAQLARMEEELQRSLAIYSAENPKIKLLEARIDQIRASIAAQSPNVDGGEVSETTILDIQLADMDARIEILASQARQANIELEELRETIERTPANQIKLSSLERDYNNIQSQYNTAVNRLAIAATGERIELLSKGQRISILDAATIPSVPTKPNRKLISLGGIAGGAALGLAFIALLEFMNKAVRRPIEITRKLGITPIATIPYVRTPMELVVRRALFMSLFILVVVGLPVLLYAVHTFYLPLDLLMDRVVDKFRGLV